MLGVLSAVPEHRSQTWWYLISLKMSMSRLKLKGILTRSVCRISRLISWLRLCKDLMSRVGLHRCTEQESRKFNRVHNFSKCNLLVILQRANQLASTQSLKISIFTPVISVEQVSQTQANITNSWTVPHQEYKTLKWDPNKMMIFWMVINNNRREATLLLWQLR